MTKLSEASVKERSLRAQHERLCRAKDRGENVDVSLRWVEIAWIRAKNELDQIRSAS
jgi:hypothetical protein